MSGRRNLVIVRAGRASLHRQWLPDAGSPRSWDLIVSSYEDGVEPVPQADVRQTHMPGGKWDGIHALIHETDLCEAYDYIWLPDDDISASARDIEQIFAQTASHGLSVAQPSLTADSYYTHFIFNQCPGFVLRYTNFVEIMVPCLQSSVLRAVAHNFEGSMSGFGLDYVWTRLDAEPRFRAGILDSVAVHHTRPIGASLHKAMLAKGRSPGREEALLRSRYGIADPQLPVVYGGIDRHGRRIEGRVRMMLRMMLGYISALPGFSDRSRALTKIWQMVRRQILCPFCLSPLAHTADEKGSKVG